jgi:hypothetical protein
MLGLKQEERQQEEEVSKTARGNGLFRATGRDRRNVPKSNMMDAALRYSLPYPQDIRSGQIVNDLASHHIRSMWVFLAPWWGAEPRLRAETMTVNRRQQPLFTQIINTTNKHHFYE